MPIRNPLGGKAITIPDFKTPIASVARKVTVPPPVYRPVNRGEMDDQRMWEAKAAQTGTEQQLGAATPPTDTTGDLIAQLLAAGGSGASSGSGRRGGGGGGGAKVVSPQVHDAMLAYLDYLKSRSGIADKPFDDETARVNAAAGEGRSSITGATDLLQQHIAAAQATAAQQAQMRDASMAQLRQQYGAASGDALQRALADLRGQGVGTGTLEAQNMANQQAWSNNQLQQGNSRATMDAALQQYLGNQNATAQMASLGGTQGLENTRLAMLAQIAQQRAAAQAAEEEKMQQFRLQMATAGVTPP